MCKMSIRVSIPAAIAIALLLHCGAAATAQTIAHWTFDQGAGFLNDVSGNGNDLISMGATSVADDYDGAGTASQGSAYFNGVVAWISTINTLDLSPHEAVRITWWMKNDMPEEIIDPDTQQPVTNVGIVMEHSNNYNVSPGAFFLCTNENAMEETSGGHVGMRFNGSTSVGHTELIPHSLDAWEKFSLEIDRNNIDPAEVMRMYHNDVLLPNAESHAGLQNTNTLTLANQVMYVGSRANTAHFYNGGLDEVKIEDVTGGTTIAHWQFETGDDFLTDSSGNGNHLTGTASSVADDYDGTGTDSNGSALFDGATTALQTAASLDLSGTRHVKFSWWQKTDTTAGILFEQSTDYNFANGTVVIGPNLSGNAGSPGAAAVHLYTADPTYQYNADQFAHDTTMQWEEFTCEINLDATDPAEVVVLTSSGQPLPDETCWNLHDLNRPVATFINDYFNFGTRADVMDYYFEGNIDDVLIEAFVPGGTQEDIPGDANQDGAVDVSDLGILATHYGATSGKEWAQGDFTGDGAVDVSDLGVLATHYGETAVAANVPEPASFAILTVGLVLSIGLTRGRRRG